MSTQDSSGILRFDVNNDKDLAVLVRTGLVWKGGPATTRKAIAYLRAHPDEVNDLVPEQVLAVLQPQPDQVSGPEGTVPAVSTEQPVEQPVEGEVPGAPTP